MKGVSVLLLGCAVLPRYLAAQCPDGSPPPCRIATRPGPAPNSVAVLYFDNLSPDTADLYLADGLTEELILRLGQVARLSVKSRAAVTRYRRFPGDPVALGRTLGVAHLVNGSVRRSGSRLRVTVELVRVADGERVWGDFYDRSTSDLLAIEEEVARTVATTIAGRLLPGERSSLALRPTRNAAAYEHYLRGNFALARRRQADLVAAIQEYEAAGRLDSLFTQAWSRAGYAYALACGYGHPTLDLDSLLARGQAAVGAALRNDSSSADAWMAMGLLRTIGDARRPGSARAAFARAIALDPGNAEALHQYGDLLAALMEDSAAVALYHRALAFEPERPITLMSLARLNMIAHRYTDAMRWSDSALSIDPTFALGHGARFAIAWLMGDAAAAKADAQWLGGVSVALLDYRSGDTVRARGRVDSLLAPVLTATGSLPVDDANNLTFPLMAVGERDAALAVLERARPRGLGLWAWLRAPWLDPIRNEPRFQRLLEESRPE